MKYSFALAALSILVGSVSAAWHQVWSDEFNGNHLNDSDWTYEARCKVWNNEEECYTAHRPQNVRVEGGHLVIDVKVENMEDKHFTSGRIYSKHAWTYGKFEARIRVPSGKQLWPAFWLLPRDNHYGVGVASGEIDILEMRGDKPHVIMSTIHYGGNWPNYTSHGSGERQYPMDFSQDYHNFAVEWDDLEIRFYIDGQRYHTENINKPLWSGKGINPYTKNGQPFDQPFFLIFNVAVGGTFFGKVPPVTPQEAHAWPKHTMEVDWVRVYQWKKAQ